MSARGEYENEVGAWLAARPLTTGERVAIRDLYNQGWPAKRTAVYLAGQYSRKHARPALNQPNQEPTP